MVPNRARRVFSFPDPVNETSARIVAFGVVVLAATFLLVRDGWVLGVLVFGFAARVLTGPTLSPLGQFSTRVATPLLERSGRIDSRQVPGPPKRFAQSIGLAFTVGASLAWMSGLPVVSYVLIALLIGAASLEAFASICLGCIAFSAIWGCDDCDDISDRLRQAVVQSQMTLDAEPRPSPTR